MNPGRFWTALFLVIGLTLASVSNAVALVEAPRAFVAASLVLAPASQGGGFACPNSTVNGYFFQLHGTERDRSVAPHPELSGRLIITGRTVVTYSPSGDPSPAWVVLHITLRSGSGAIRYRGTANLAGVDDANGLVARGLLVARLYRDGVPTPHGQLVADLAVHLPNPDGSGGMSGAFGLGTPRSIAVENRAGC